jgi:hypothetical protein
VDRITDCFLFCDTRSFVIGIQKLPNSIKIFQDTLKDEEAEAGITASALLADPLYSK